MPKIGRVTGPSYAGVTDAPTPQQVAIALVHRGTAQFSEADRRVLELHATAKTAGQASDEPAESMAADHRKGRGNVE
jgi:hypothetical protein